MTKRRPSVPASIVQSLIKEAGGKCANPGCSVTLTQLHHINEWHVHKSHDAKIMIALCATCHDHVHRGELRLTDETLYRWKRIEHSETEPHWASIAAQPRTQRLPLLLGPFAIASAVEEAGLLRLGGANWLTLRVLEGGVVQVDTEIRDAAGEQVLKVVRSQVVAARRPEVEFQGTPGRVLITVPATEDFIPSWVLLNFLRIKDSFIRSDGRAVALDIEVTAPGQVRVEGYWLSKYHAAAITSKAVLVASYSTEGPIVLQAIGEGAPPILGGDSLRPDGSYFGLDIPLEKGFYESMITLNVSANRFGEKRCVVVFKDASKIEIAQSRSQWQVRNLMPKSCTFQFEDKLLSTPTLAHRLCETLESVQGRRRGVFLKFVDNSDFWLPMELGSYQVQQVNRG